MSRLTRIYPANLSDILLRWRHPANKGQDMEGIKEHERFTRDDTADYKKAETIVLSDARNWQR